MKNILIIFSAFTFLYSCVPPPPDLSADAERAIWQTDKAMSDLAAKEGFFKALLHYADSEMVKFSEGQAPVIGRNAFAGSISEKDGPRTLSWEPVKAWGALSGDMGYSWGFWKFVKPDTTFHGNYFTAWKKQADGSWKWVLDGGNNTPAP